MTTHTLSGYAYGYATYSNDTLTITSTGTIGGVGFFGQSNSTTYNGGVIFSYAAAAGAIGSDPSSDGGHGVPC